MLYRFLFEINYTQREKRKTGPECETLCNTALCSSPISINLEHSRWSCDHVICSLDCSGWSQVRPICTHVTPPLLLAINVLQLIKLRQKPQVFGSSEIAFPSLSGRCVSSSFPTCLPRCEARPETVLIKNARNGATCSMQVKISYLYENMCFELLENWYNMLNFGLRKSWHEHTYQRNPKNQFTKSQGVQL